MLQDSDLLQTIAEIAIALTGFTGVVAVLGERGRGKWRAVDLFRFSNLLMTSIAVLFLAFVPILIHKLGAPELTAWRLSSGMAAAYILVAVTRGRSIRRLPQDEQVEIHRPVLGALLAIHAAVFLLLVASGLGVAYSGESGPFLVGLVWLLAFSVFSFVRLLLLLQAGSEGAG